MLHSVRRERLLAGDIATAFFDLVRRQARILDLLSDEHFIVDGMLLEAWAGQTSFKRRETPPDPADDSSTPRVTCRGERRRNATHASTADPDAQLYRKGSGREAKLAYVGHVLLESRHGSIANICAPADTGAAERDALLLPTPSAPPGGAVGGDKNSDVRSLVTGVRELAATLHLGQKIAHGAVDDRTTCHEGYAIRKRKLIEHALGWMKTVVLPRKLRHRSGQLVEGVVIFMRSAYKWTRMRTLCATCSA